MALHRNRAWADIRIAGTLLVAAAPLRLDLLVNAPAVDTLTAVRIIGDITVQYEVTTTVTDSLSIVDLGIGVSSIEAFNVAAAVALPDPSSDLEYPPRGWLYVSSQPVAQLVTTDGGIINEKSRFQFDIRSMRKIDKGILFMVIEQNNVTIGGGMIIVGRVRTLCLT